MSAILLDHFYHIDSLDVSEGKVNATVTFERNHAIFQGHFPGMPVVPGVCQTQMLAEVLGRVLGKELQLATAASIKFLSLVDPVKTPSLHLSITYVPAEDIGYQVSAQYSQGETVFFKFKGAFTIS
ncbi:MAG: 3-hydroxyacyl-ACP dehydratase [Bacteroidetes bacterium]|nr:3-hydroxyacyl-ACP dehydratase [Bacteroidota bacterium]